MPEQNGQAWAHVINNNIAHSLLKFVDFNAIYDIEDEKKYSLMVEIAYYLERNLLISNNFWDQNLISPKRNPFCFVNEWSRDIIN